MTRRSTILTFAWIGAAASLGSGCSTPRVFNRGDSTHNVALPMRTDGDPAYRVASGDVLEVVNQKGRNQRVEVHIDGTVQVGKGEPVRVDEKTADEIAAALSEKLGADYANCQVKIAKYNSQFIYVYGDNRQESPRAVPYQGRETLREFLSRVGCRSCQRGFRARVVRPGQRMDENPELVAVKLDADLYNRDRSAEPVYLKPNDYVYLERDGSGPGGIVPRGSKFWPFTKFTFQWWRRNERQDDRMAHRSEPADREPPTSRSQFRDAPARSAMRTNPTPRG